MKVKNNGEKKISYSLFMTAFTLLALVLAFFSYAWFSNNDSVDANENTIAMYEDERMYVSDIKILKRDGIEGARNVYGDNVISLTEYDSIFRDKNVDTPLIIRAEISAVPKREDGTYAPINFSVVTKMLPGYDDWRHKEGGKIVFEKLLSNIIDVRCDCGTAELNSITNFDELYTASIAYLEEAPAKTFVTKNGDNDYSKTNSINFIVNNYGDYVFEKNGKNAVVVYVEINYVDELVDAYIEQHGDIISEDTTIFDSDIATIRFYEEEEEED